MQHTIIFCFPTSTSTKTDTFWKIFCFYVSFGNISAYTFTSSINLYFLNFLLVFCNFTKAAYLFFHELLIIEVVISTLLPGNCQYFEIP